MVFIRVRGRDLDRESRGDNVVSMSSSTSDTRDWNLFPVSMCCGLSVFICFLPSSFLFFCTLFSRVDGEVLVRL